ncbi:hypothetical protein ACTMS2_03560 [Micromonospora sp. SD12]|uniref:hypothetical protein n=1 Tax=Micromonospora sp. SD12 TaxID=3452216 RepID=UPI003F8A798B
MAALEEWGPVFRRIVNDGGDITDIARVMRAGAASGSLIWAGSALRREFGLTVREVVNVIAWAEAPGDDRDEEGLAWLRSEVRTPLR